MCLIGGGDERREVNLWSDGHGDREGRRLGRLMIRLLDRQPQRSPLARVSVRAPTRLVLSQRALLGFAHGSGGN